VALSGPGYDIVGVTIGRIGPVKNLVHVELNVGVTALYGINGVGKTRVISLLQHALLGTTPEPERPDYPVKSFLDVHVRWHEPRPELAQAVEQWDGHGTDRDMWLPAAEEAAAAGTTTLRAIGDPREPAWREFLSCSATMPAAAMALSTADDFWKMRRIEERPWAELHAQMPPFDVRYWGSDADPRWTHDIPLSVHVPLFPVQAVSAARWFEEIREERGTTTPIRDFQGGLRLASVVTNLEQPLDPDRYTMQALLAATDGVSFGFFDEYGGSPTDLNEDIADLLESVQRRANEFIKQILINPPQLQFDLMGPEDWVRGRNPRWRADGDDFGHLSRAVQHWVALTTALAHAQEPVVFLCDEPELGLHRAVEQRLATGLSAVSRAINAATIVTTHSPALLGSAHVKPLQVIRDSADGVAFRAVSLSVVDGKAMRASATALGLTIGDLLAMAKVTVVVEGIHDVWVLRYLLGDSVDAAPAGIVPMHGGTRLRSLADASLIIDGTDSQVLVVLDDANAEGISDAFEKVKRAHAGHDSVTRDLALQDIREMGRKNDSYLFLHQFALRAAEVNNLDRIHIHGLSLPDVICYLDPDTLLSNKESWDRLINAWTSEAAPAPPKNIKGWLRRKKLLPDAADDVDQAIERAILQMQQEQRPLHTDLVELGLRIVALAQPHS